MKKLKYFVLFLIFVAVIYPVASSYLENRADEKSAKNLESGVILYDIEGYKFDVPLKYYYLIHQKTNRWPTPKKERQSVKSFEIDVVLPDMLPYSEQTAEKFEARGWKDKMWITLHTRNKVMDDFGGWFKKNKHKYKIIGLPNEAPDLIKIIDHRGAIVENDENYSEKYFKSINNFREYFYIQCNHESKEIFPTFPSCKIFMEYEKIQLEITFSRKYLMDWKKIIKNSIELLDGFRVKTN